MDVMNTPVISALGEAPAESFIGFEETVKKFSETKEDLEQREEDIPDEVMLPFTFQQRQQVLPDEKLQLGMLQGVYKNMAVKKIITQTQVGTLSQAQPPQAAVSAKKVAQTLQVPVSPKKVAQTLQATVSPAKVAQPLQASVSPAKVAQPLQVLASQANMVQSFQAPVSPEKVAQSPQARAFQANMAQPHTASSALTTKQSIVAKTVETSQHITETVPTALPLFSQATPMQLSGQPTSISHPSFMTSAMLTQAMAQESAEGMEDIGDSTYRFSHSFGTGEHSVNIASQRVNQGTQFMLKASDQFTHDVLAHHMVNDDAQGGWILKDRQEKERQSPEFPQEDEE